MKGYNRIKIQHICSNICSGGTPKSTVLDYYNGNIPWLNTKEIKFNRIYDTEKTITDEGYNNSSAKWIPANSIIVAMYGATAGKTAINKIPLTTNQACCNLVIDSDKADYRFVYYALCSDYTYIASLANGGAQQNLNVQQIKELEIPFPSIEEQKRIANILSFFDDKIELNRRINENLEQQAQALFKSWFVDFEPFKNGKFVDSELGMIPKGWKVGQLLDFGKIICGKTPSKNIKEFFGGDIPFIKIPDMHNQLFIINTEDSLSVEGSQTQQTKLLPPYSLLVSCIATVGLVAINTRTSHTNQQINSIVPQNKNSLYYLYLNLTLMKKQLENMGRGGTATLNINTTLFGKIRIIIPNNEVLDKFSHIVEPLFKEIEILSKQTFELAYLRDTLLPKLMSGELKINDFNN